LSCFVTRFDAITNPTFKLFERNNSADKACEWM
jgi:hypothetical protein